MSWRFVDGPLAGSVIDHSRILEIGSCFKVRTEEGNRLFVAIASPEECDAILAGEMSRDRVEKYYTYESHHLPNDEVEFRLAPAGELAAARQESKRPRTAEEEARKKRFSRLADELIARVRREEFTGSTDVYLTTVFEDEAGNAAGRSARNLISPPVTVTIPGDRPRAVAEAKTAYVETVVENINALVRATQVGWRAFPGAAGKKVRVADIVLEIEHPSDPA